MLVKLCGKRKFNVLLSGLAALLMLGAFNITPASAQNAENLRLERLNLMFEGNVSANAYIRHCHDESDIPTTAFKRNFDLTAGELAEAMTNNYEGLNVSKAVEALGQKQSEMRAALDQFYQQNGCDTSQAQAAERHFEMFNQYGEQQMQAFLDNIENE